MRLRHVGVLLVVLLVPVVGSAKALLPPHDKAETTAACYSCHNLMVVSPGGSYDYTPGCMDCHNRDNAFGAWTEADQAVPGVSGAQHSWRGAANNAALGTTSALIPDRFLLVDGNLQCVNCHDIHDTFAAVDPRSMHVSMPRNDPQNAVGSYGASLGTARMTLTVPEGTAAEGFRVRIASADATGGTFIVSHDYAWNSPTWMVWSGAWVAGTDTGAGRRFEYGATYSVDVDLDVAGVKVRFDKGPTGTEPGATVGDYWDFYVGYPFLRLSNVDDNGCTSCHPTFKMNWSRARGLDSTYLPNGVRKFSHPVGDALNANNFNRDRATILDADGTVGVSAGDGLDPVTMETARNDSNNLVLSATSKVQCTTCHAPHNADSNSLSVDVR
jgi:hypothetical protein